MRFGPFVRVGTNTEILIVIDVSGARVLLEDDLGNRISEGIGKLVEVPYREARAYFLACDRVHADGEPSAVDKAEIERLRVDNVRLRAEVADLKAQRHVEVA